MDIIVNTHNIMWSYCDICDLQVALLPTLAPDVRRSRVLPHLRQLCMGGGDLDVTLQRCLASHFSGLLTKVIACASVCVCVCVCVRACVLCVLGVR